MDAPFGSNLPRRKSRLRPRDTEIHRRPSDPSEPEAESEPPLAEEEDFDAASHSATEPPPESTVEELAPESAVEEPASEFGAAAGDEDNELPAAFRLNRIAGESRAALSPWRDWRWWAMAAVTLGVGLLAGFGWGKSARPTNTLGDRVAREAAAIRNASLTASAQTLSDVDAAFAASKAAKYDEARAMFNTLSQAHPEWPSMTIEVSRTYLYQRQPQEAQRILTALTLNRAIPDADFMLALVHLTNQEYTLAEASFANAVALDPSRPDFYYFWGECLRRDGKPLEAVDRFRSAMLRNQYENAEGLYQLKFWLSQIQADREGGETNAAIDKALASSRPPYEAYFAAAAREIKAKRFPRAAELISKAQVITEPAVFNVIMQDAAFLDERAHPELAPFYQP